MIIIKNYYFITEVSAVTVFSAHAKVAPPPKMKLDAYVSRTTSLAIFPGRMTPLHFMIL